MYAPKLYLLKATHWGEGDVLTDLYYADIYDEFGDFCSWDENNNGRYGETYHEHHQTYDLDGVDLFPDVQPRQASLYGRK